MSKDRGFKKLIGKTIRTISAKAINEVLLVDGDGEHYVIQAEAEHLGIPVVSLKKLKVKKHGIPENKLRPLKRAKQKAKDAPEWPFPNANHPDEDRIDD